MSYTTHRDQYSRGSSFPSPRPHYDVPSTRANRDHAAEAVEIKEDLMAYKIFPEMVAPTRDRAGVVRLNFDAVAWLLEMLDHAYKGVPPTLD